MKRGEGVPVAAIWVSDFAVEVPSIPSHRRPAGRDRRARGRGRPSRPKIKGRAADPGRVEVKVDPAEDIPPQGQAADQAGLRVSLPAFRSRLRPRPISLFWYPDPGRSGQRLHLSIRPDPVSGSRSAISVPPAIPAHRPVHKIPAAEFPAARSRTTTLWPYPGPSAPFFNQ